MRCFAALLFAVLGNLLAGPVRADATAGPWLLAAPPNTNKAAVVDSIMVAASAGQPGRFGNTDHGNDDLQVKLDPWRSVRVDIAAGEASGLSWPAGAETTEHGVDLPVPWENQIYTNSKFRLLLSFGLISRGGSSRAYKLLDDDGGLELPTSYFRMAAGDRLSGYFRPLALTDTAANPFWDQRFKPPRQSILPPGLPISMRATTPNPAGPTDRSCGDTLPFRIFGSGRWMPR